MNRKLFHVITAISNPIRYKARYRLYRRFAAEMKIARVPFWTVELAFGKRPHVVTEADNPYHIQLRTYDEVWHKENLLNVALSRLPNNWKYVAWIDADVSPLQHPRNWIKETMHQLQHYAVVQMFETAIDMGPTGQALQLHQGFMAAYLKGLPMGNTAYGNWHPGFCWAANKYAINGLGGLLDSPAILGAADHHMALALINKAERSYPADVHPNYKKQVLAWQKRANEIVKKDVGYVPGTIIHHWHGKKKDRKYTERWDIYRIPPGFDPELDIKKDWQGVFQLTDHNIRLRDAIRKYFRDRNEDSIDLV